MSNAYSDIEARLGIRAGGNAPIYSRPASKTTSLREANDKKASMYDDMKTRESFNAAVRANLDQAVAQGYAKGSDDAHISMVQQMEAYEQSQQPAVGTPEPGLLDEVLGRSDVWQPSADYTRREHDQSMEFTRQNGIPESELGGIEQGSPTDLAHKEYLRNIGQ